MKYTSSLKGNYLFRRTLKNGKFYRGKSVILHVLPISNKQKNYLGICVSKKNGNSVIRNKMKRWIREIYKNEESGLKTGFNYVFLFKKTILGKDLNYNTLNEEVKKLFVEANSINE